MGIRVHTALAKEIVIELLTDQQINERAPGFVEIDNKESRTAKRLVLHDAGGQEMWAIVGSQGDFIDLSSILFELTSAP